MKVKDIQVGQIVCSTQGRDKGQYYIVLDYNDMFAFIVDGKCKCILKPKKKNIVHLQATPVINTEIASKLKNKIKINDQMIYHSLYEYKKGIKGVNNGN